MGQKKVLYISNINLNGKFLPGVIHKIFGQEKAFKSAGFKIDLLYPDEKKIILIKDDGTTHSFAGAAKTYTDKGLFAKAFLHIKNSWYGTMDFSDCLPVIRSQEYDALYLRFFMPGIWLIEFLQSLKNINPGLTILLEYPTLNIKELFQSSMIRKLSYFFNRKRIDQLNGLSDYIITLTRDTTLFGKPAVFMANGIDLDNIVPVTVPELRGKIIMMGVASDCAHYHGFDKVIKGVAEYKKKINKIDINVRIVSNPLSTHVNELKKLVQELGLSENIIFELPMTRSQLAAEYSKIHLGIGTLALHRVGLMDNYSLKHREYAAFGIPFIMSKGDSQFENIPFVFTVERDENPLDIQSIIDFYSTLRRQYINYSTQFRQSIENEITWKAQMKEVFAVINNKR